MCAHRLLTWVGPRASANSYRCSCKWGLYALVSYSHGLVANELCEHPLLARVGPRAPVAMLTRMGCECPSNWGHECPCHSWWCLCEWACVHVHRPATHTPNNGLRATGWGPLIQHICLQPQIYNLSWIIPRFVILAHKLQKANSTFPMLLDWCPASLKMWMPSKFKLLGIENYFSFLNHLSSRCLFNLLEAWIPLYSWKHIQFLYVFKFLSFSFLILMLSIY